MNDNYERRLAALSIGLAGSYGEMSDGGRVNYQDSRLRPYFGELVEGGFVIVKTAILEHRPRLAVLSPLCRGSLAPGQRKAFQMSPDNFVAQAIASADASENPAAGIARMMLAAPECGAFDDVAPDVYAAWWALHGAKVGQRRGEAIVWQDGTEDAIPPFAQRYRDAAAS